MRKTCNAIVAAACLIALPARTQNQPRSAPMPSNVAHGQAVYQRWCAGCHGADATLAGTYTLEQRYQGAEPAALKQRTDLTPAYINWIVRHGINLMPRTRKTEVSDADLADVVAYLTRVQR